MRWRKVLRRLGMLGVLGGCAAQEPTEPGPRSGHDPGAFVAASIDAGAPSPPESWPLDAAAPRCTLSPDCEAVPLVFLSLEPCCTPASSCGLEVRGAPPDFAETVASALELPRGETCAPRERFFITHPGSDDLRIADPAGEQILLTTGCNNASILSINFIGCCMRNNRCGVSTYGIWDTIAVLAPEAPFAKLECVSSRELNAQIADSKFRGMRFLPDTDAPCDYAALDARLPPLEEL